jgi:hypothetical protein
VRLPQILLALGQLTWIGPLQASAPSDPSPSELVDEKPTEGQPTVVLDRLTFPRDVVGAASFEAQLKKTLRREVSRVDWGAGRENRIEYRFSVTELKYTLVEGALRAHCSAKGQLPRGQTANSELTFSGHPSERVALTNKVLEIVARGVVTRLAELERKRRGLR